LLRGSGNRYQVTPLNEKTPEGSQQLGIVSKGVLKPLVNEPAIRLDVSLSFIIQSDRVENKKLSK
jgi:hypothetical protein